MKRTKDYVMRGIKMATAARSKFVPLMAAIKNEGEETREAFDLLLKASRGQLKDDSGNARKLTGKEVEYIKEQALDVLKVVGITSIAILPGGTLVFILLRLFRLNERILPSSFKSKKDI